MSRIKNEYELRKGVEIESKRFPTQTAFAKFLGLPKDTLNKFILGRQGLSDALAKAFGYERVYRRIK